MEVIMSRLVVVINFLIMFSLASADKKLGVSYDGRSLTINGRRELLFSGSVHYTRSTPDMWPEIISKAKDGGLNVIQTYVFWNIHEPVKGKYNFEGKYDVVKFIKLIGKHGMYVTLRVGPFIEAEWNHGGLPFWLREEKNITFRTDNPQFKYYMKRYMKMIIKKMKEEKLFASEGGPIILAQVENEYNNLENVFKAKGTKYIKWAAKLSVGLKTGVPWIMCKQNDAPDPIINTCNGRQCGDTFTGPNRPNKPSLWTENWTAPHGYAFGDPPSHRTAQDLAYSVARWFSKNGTLANYYMYHGGTNFGRTSASFVTTRYYDDAPLDEYGLKREPKWSHLKHLHTTLKLCSKALLLGTPSTLTLGPDLEARIYEKTGKGEACAAFLTNRQPQISNTVDFRGHKYFLPPHSITILPDCNNAVFNTHQIESQHNERNFVKSKNANKNLEWKMYKEKVPSPPQLNKLISTTPLELYGLTKDTSDYAWYTTSINLKTSDLPRGKHISPVLRVASLGHAMLAFVNGEFVGAAHGSNIEKSFVLENRVNLKPGNNTITLLASLMGLPDSGAYLEHRYAGPRGVALLGLNTGILDLTSNGWGHQIGSDGERKKIYSEAGSSKVDWTNAEKGNVLTWYKTQFNTPEGKDPVAVRMTRMGKGMIWINGNNIGRYWMSYLSPLGKPSQSEYHIPRSYLHKNGKNVMVIIEEERGSPDQIEILTVNRDTLCSLIQENPFSKLNKHRKMQHQLVLANNVKTEANFHCPKHKHITKVEFASFGNPTGLCGEYVVGNCTSSSSKQVVEKHCLGKNKCKIPVDRKHLHKGRDDCPHIQKVLAVQVKCGKS